MKKKVIVSVIGLIGLVTIAFGCGASNAKAKDEKSIQNITEADYWGWKNWNAYEYVDPDTGIHYLALYSENNGDVTSLTPRLNSDGTVMVDKESRK